MIQTRHNNLNTGTINLSETKEKFLENILREISPQLTDKQYNTLRIVLVNELEKVEILDPLRGYDERLEDECDKLLFYNYYQTNKMENVVHEVCVKGCKIDRYEKTHYKQLELWELKDRLDITRPLVTVYNLPDDIAEEIIDYSLKLIEEGERK